MATWCLREQGFRQRSRNCVVLCHAALCCAGLVLQLYRWLVSHGRLVPREQGFRQRSRNCVVLCHAALCCAGLVLQLYRWLVSHGRLVPREQGFLRLQQGRRVGYKARARNDILAKK
jgi:hypothetical protein